MAMSTFELYGYTTQKTYSRDTDTWVYYYALLKTTVTQKFLPRVMFF